MVPSVSALRDSIVMQYMPMTHLQCALEEGCLAKQAGRLSSRGYRRLLRFDSFIINVGCGDFIPYEDTSDWEYHECHNHYHSHKQFTSYELLYLDGTQATEGHKASFCLEDTECLYGSKRFFCSGRRAQGISVGCGDLYSSRLDCQWLDVTDVPDYTEYDLKITANPLRNPAELDYCNNVVTCRIYIHTGTSVRVQSPPGCRLSVPDDCHLSAPDDCH